MLNKVILIGNLTRAPEGRQTNGGTSVCNIGIAINRKFKNAQGQLQEDVVFVDGITVWGATADFCTQYLKKGAKVCIDGRLKLDTWEDTATGQKRSKLGVVAESVQNLSPRPEGQQGGGNGYQQPPQQAPQGQAPTPPPPPPPPGQQQPAVQPAPGEPGMFDVTDEGIDDIPFN